MFILLLQLDASGDGQDYLNGQMSFPHYAKNACLRALCNRDRVQSEMKREYIMQRSQENVCHVGWRWFYLFILIQTEAQ